jgi:hypothetical protein
MGGMGGGLGRVGSAGRRSSMGPRKRISLKCNYASVFDPNAAVYSHC